VKRVPASLSAAGRGRHRGRLTILSAVLLVAACAGLARAEAGPDDLAGDVRIEPPGGPARSLDLAAAMRVLNVPSVGVAVLADGRIAWSRGFGSERDAKPLYQAASMSKFVAAVVALRLVDMGVLTLDAPVDATLRSFKTARPPLTDGRPVTLRRLLAMRAGIGVPGFLGYDPGAPLPTLAAILDGTPPANSAAVRVVTQPGSRYAYSGGGYEIVEALIGDATGRPFAEIARERVLAPLGMADSVFAAPLPTALTHRAAQGHDADGRTLPSGGRVMPELAAAGLWSTPEDLARLLASLVDGWRGRPGAVLSRATIEVMLTPEEGGPYGLGASVAGTGRSRVLMKRGQNIGYQGYLILFPETGQGMVVMTGSDNGTTIAEALIRRAAEVYGWPALGRLCD
jgi:CubicO group peptidase (beta-lactamase class C family)